jgi:hypothetical protein
MPVMDAGQTTAAIQAYLDEFDGAAGTTAAGPVVSALLGRAVRRLRDLCAAMLYRDHLTRRDFGHFPRFGVHPPRRERVRHRESDAGPCDLVARCNRGAGMTSQL